MIFLLPLQKILTNLNLDCAINSGSFGNEKRDIREYFQLIEKNLRKGGFFLIITGILKIHQVKR